MSIITQFPDAIVFPDGTIRLVTIAAKSVAESNTDIRSFFSLGADDPLPDYVFFDCSGPELLEDEGLVVKWEQMPLGHYRSKQRRWPKSAVSGEAKVIDFLQRIPEEHREKAMFRDYGRHPQRQPQETKKRAKPKKKPTKRKQS